MSVVCTRIESKERKTMTKVIERKYCEVCEYETPLAEVICIDIMNDTSWSEPRCKPCFDFDLPWEELYG
jgi:hypothetical protein